MHFRHFRLREDYCTCCGEKCYHHKSPEIIFRDEKNCVCENCSIDYEETEEGIHIRKDLLPDVDIDFKLTPCIINAEYEVIE